AFRSASSAGSMRNFRSRGAFSKPGALKRRRDRDHERDRNPERNPSMTTYKVVYLVGSLAKASINRKLAKALARLAPRQLDMAQISFKELPHYSHDYHSDFPPVPRAFQDASASADAVLFVTPEYNRSTPGGLKNAIDWASRPYGKNAFTGK